jgi:hypothetical protein
MVVIRMCHSIPCPDEFLDYVILFLHIYVKRILYRLVHLSNGRSTLRLWRTMMGTGEFAQGK